MVRKLEKELLSAEDVAALLGVGKATVWRWCREGRLPAFKVGKHWRVRRRVLEDFLKDRESPRTLVEHLDSFLRTPDNILAVAQNREILHRLDAAFFRVGAARGGLLVKFYGGEKDSEDELRDQFERNGLEVRRLEREGRFLMKPEEDPLNARSEVLGQMLEKESGQGRTVWASFDWALEVDPETVLKQQGRLNELVDDRQLVVKTAALQEAIDEWTAAVLSRAQASHSGTILASEKGLSLGRSTPMPQT